MRWIRKALPYLGLLIAVAVLYDGYIFYSRWNSRQEAEKERATKEAADRARAVQVLGGGGMKILSFYAAPAAIHRGQQTSLCYSVTGAKTVKLEPAVDEVWPALTRCVKASPRKDTEYTFTAYDGAGHNTSEKVAVSVK